MKKRDIIIGLLAALFLAFFFSPFASTWPDGLEKVAKDQGFSDRAEVTPTVASPIPDYICPGIKDGRMATALAGALGVLLVFAAGYATAALLKKK